MVAGIRTLAGYAGGPLLGRGGIGDRGAVPAARRRAQLVANRIVYGQRATRYQVLSDFAQDMAGRWTPTRHWTGWRRSE